MASADTWEEWEQKCTSPVHGSFVELMAELTKIPEIKEHFVNEQEGIEHA